MSTPAAPADEHATPLTFEEEQQLIPAYVTTRDQLNVLEQAAYLQGVRALGRRRLTAARILTEAWLLSAHKILFGDIWKWAGKIRTSERSIGVAHWEIRARLRVLLDDVGIWLQYGTYPPDEIAVRFHHRLVLIHCFVNGNGRHARLVADLLVERLGRPPFTWGSGSIVGAGEVRRRYISALKAADDGEYELLIEFARS